MSEKLKQKQETFRKISKGESHLQEARDNLAKQIKAERREDRTKTDSLKKSANVLSGLGGHEDAIQTLKNTINTIKPNQAVKIENLYDETIDNLENNLEKALKMWEAVKNNYQNNRGDVPIHTWYGSFKTVYFDQRLELSNLVTAEICTRLRKALQNHPNVEKIIKVVEYTFTKVVPITYHFNRLGDNSAGFGLAVDLYGYSNPKDTFPSIYKRYGGGVNNLCQLLDSVYECDSHFLNCKYDYVKNNFNYLLAPSAGDEFLNARDEDKTGSVLNQKAQEKHEDYMLAVQSTVDDIEKVINDVFSKFPPITE